MPSLVLIGAPGAGKSTIGKLLADSVECEFVDTDTAIEQSEGRSISDIFLNDGEAYFREVEQKSVHETLQRAGEQDMVVSLGGGSILSQQTREELGALRVAWLQVSISDAMKRVGMNQSRPLLLGNVRANMITLLAERTPLYESVADLVIDTSSQSVDDCVRELQPLLKEKGSFT